MFLFLTFPNGNSEKRYMNERLGKKRGRVGGREREKKREQENKGKENTR